MKNKLQYEIGDIIGVCSDEMYEFEIFQASLEENAYGARCVRAHKNSTIKLGDEYKVSPEQIVVLLGKNGKRWPV